MPRIAKENIKNPNGAGRKCTVTLETLAKLEQAFAFGCTDKEACLFAGVSVDSLYRYQEKNEEFRQRKELLKENPVLLARQEVISGFPGNPELALKFLERKKKDEFSLKTESKVEGEVKLPMIFYPEKKAPGEK